MVMLVCEIGQLGVYTILHHQLPLILPPSPFLSAHPLPPFCFLTPPQPSTTSDPITPTQEQPPLKPY